MHAAGGWSGQIDKNDDVARWSLNNTKKEAAEMLWLTGARKCNKHLCRNIKGSKKYILIRIQYI